MSIKRLEAKEGVNKPSTKVILLFRSLFAVFCALGFSGDTNSQLKNKDTINDTAPVELDFKDAIIVPGSAPKGGNKDSDINGGPIDIPVDARMA